MDKTDKAQKDVNDVLKKADKITDWLESTEKAIKRIHQLEQEIKEKSDNRKGNAES